MTTLVHVTEYVEMAQQQGNLLGVGTEPALAEYDLDIAAGEAHGSTLNAKTNFVRIWAEGKARIAIAVTAVAADSTGFKVMSAGQTEYFGIGQAIKGLGRVSAITKA